MQVCLLTSDRPWSNKYSLMNGILRLVFRVSTCIFKPGKSLPKPVPSVANDNQELQQQWEFSCSHSMSAQLAKSISNVAYILLLFSTTMIVKFLLIGRPFEQAA